MDKVSDPLVHTGSTTFRLRIDKILGPAGLTRQEKEWSMVTYHPAMVFKTQIPSGLVFPVLTV